MTISNDSELLFQEVDKSVQQYMHHPYLQANEIHQSVSRFHFDIANAILNISEISLSQRKIILEAVLLLHQGLSIHDKVDTPTHAMRQLFVLAGDYNSSQYYFILSQLGDQNLLFSLCEAVIKINEAKTFLLNDSQRLSSEEYLQYQVIIQGGLLETLAEYFLNEVNHWLPQIHSLVKAYVVQHMIQTKKTEKGISLRQTYDWLTDSLEKISPATPNSFTGPLYKFLIEYFIPVKNSLESLTLVEGNR